MRDFHIIITARIVERAERDHAAGMPLSACTYNPLSAAYATHKAVYARLNSQHTNDAPSAAGRADLAQHS